MPILTSTTAATSLVRLRSPARRKTDPLSLGLDPLQPAFFSLHRLLSATAFIICSCVVQLSFFLFQTVRFLLLNAIFACKIFARNGVVAARVGAATVWKRTE